jgi:hypothetical protein
MQTKNGTYVLLSGKRGEDRRAQMSGAQMGMTALKARSQLLRNFHTAGLSRAADRVLA